MYSFSHPPTIVWPDALVRGEHICSTSRLLPLPLSIYLHVSLIETLLTSVDSAGHPVPDDPSALTPLPHYLPIPFPYSGRFSGGGRMWSHPMSAFTSTPSERTMDEHSSKWRYLVGLANCPRGPRGLPIA
eukprot:scaffold10517_cov113-Isochrysis_galbana.AAC.4